VGQKKSTNNYDYFKFVISVRVSHCDCSTRALGNLTTSLLLGILLYSKAKPQWRKVGLTGGR